MVLSDARCNTIGLILRGCRAGFFWLFLDFTFGILGNTDGKENVAATTEVELRPTTEVALTSSNVRRVPNPVMQGLKVITFYL